MILSVEDFKNDYKAKLISMFRQNIEDASPIAKYMAFGSVICDYIAPDWHMTEENNNKENKKQVYYFSMEFLIGRLMDSILINLGIRDVVRSGLEELGISLESLEETEPDAGLGNGGLGRLAACFIDSMASLGIAGHGVGIRYKFGLFQQQINNGYQIESPDNWLKIANVWETRRDDCACIVRFYGQCNVGQDQNGNLEVFHENYEPILAVPYDMPVPGYKNGVVNTLRLWSAETQGSGFDYTMFRKGDFEKATESQAAANYITNVLYPDDSTERGKLLRLKQEYFFTSAGIQSIVASVKKRGISMRDFHDHVAIQINDTHPALAVPELMRILIDEEKFDWDTAWSITTRTLAYTNHTILAEALEKWKISMFKTLLPRIYMIIEEINRRFCKAVAAKYNNDWNMLNRMSIVQDGVVKMAHLAIVGSHSVNGVAALHSEILQKRELKDFHEFYPGKFNNKTNGITHRRWLIEANPSLTGLIDKTIGEDWKKQPLLLDNLKGYVSDPSFRQEFSDVKRNNKIRLAEFIKDNYNISVNVDSIFDIQVKRLHMYKRQLLNVLHIMDLYNRLCDNPDLDVPPRTFIFGAKAFPGYFIAKNTIKLICTVADKVNSDPRVKDKLKVVFMPNYGVSLAEKLIPAADISEQISTASKEASGTGNMKLMMNGAVTIATLDGANVEIYQEVGDENIVLFGLKAQEVIEYERNGQYRVAEVIKKDPRIQRLLQQIKDGYFGLAPAGEFNMILDHLTVQNDPYFTLRDFDSYCKAQERIGKMYTDKDIWGRASIINTASSGVFSSDNTIQRYAKDIWNV